MGIGVPGRNIKAEVFEYVTKRDGQLVYLGDMVRDLNGIEASQIRSAMLKIRDGNMGGGAECLEVVSPGNSWRWRSKGVTANDARELFELVGVSSKGTKLVEGEDGKIYKLVEID